MGIRAGCHSIAGCTSRKRVIADQADPLFRFPYLGVIGTVLFAIGSGQPSL